MAYKFFKFLTDMAALHPDLLQFQLALNDWVSFFVFFSTISLSYRSNVNVGFVVPLFY